MPECVLHRRRVMLECVLHTDALVIAKLVPKTIRSYSGGDR